MAEEKKLSVAEVRKTIATALATAFGFVIGLLWNNVVQGGLMVAGVNLSLDPSLMGWLGYLITAIVITVVMVIFIIFISRWGNK